MKKITALLMQIVLILALAACSVAPTVEPDSGTTSQVTAENAAIVSEPLSASYSSEDLNADLNQAVTSYITLNGDSITVEGAGATVDGSTVTITSAGTYSIIGTLNNGQIAINTEDEETVTLILNGVNITNTSTSPIYVLSADKVVLTLAEGTENIVTDGASYVFANAETNEPNAAIFSKDDLTINGSGSLTVYANYNNGIATKDDLKITGGNITVNAVNDGIRGRNYIAVNDGSITVNAGGDGLQSNNDEDTTKGYILIEGGTFNITAGMDGIQAETRLTVSGGTLNIVTGGGSTVNYESEEGAKGLKAGVDVTVSGGTLNIDSADDAIHSNSSVSIDSGIITIASGDDGIHADATLTVNSGEVNIVKAYEGLESKVITINGGNIRLNVEDDGVNGAGGVDGSSVNGRPGQDTFAATGDVSLNINGGYLYVDAKGDGIDINGIINMTAGTVIVNGPTENMNGALDYDGGFNLTGGFLLAVGSSGMVQAPSTSSTQYSVMYGFDTMQAAGTMIHIQSESGEEILSFTPSKEFQSLVLSSPQLTNGATYTLFTGGSSSGTVTDGLYSGGSYSAGTQLASFTLSSVVTTVGSAGGMGPGGGGFPGGPGGNPRP